MPHMVMKHDIDPAKVIWDKVGDLNDFTLFGNKVLVGVYLRPEKTKDIKRNDGTTANLYLPDKSRDEDKYQGKACLVLKKGPAAFKSDDNFDFLGQDVDINDWVAIFVSDGRQIVINGQLCRIVEDQHIRLRIPTPDSIW